MDSHVISFIWVVFLLLDVRSTNAVPLQALGKLQDSLKTSPTTGHPSEQTASVQETTLTSKVTTTINALSSEKTFSEYASTRRTEEIKSPTVVTMTTTEVPPCLKERNRIQDMLNKYTMLGMVIADLSPPGCDRDGFYKPLQCQFNGCYCVDRYGRPNSKFNHEGFGILCPEPEVLFADEPSR